MCGFNSRFEYKLKIKELEHSNSFFIVFQKTRRERKII